MCTTRSHIWFSNNNFYAGVKSQVITLNAQRRKSVLTKKACHWAQITSWIPATLTTWRTGTWKWIWCACQPPKLDSWSLHTTLGSPLEDSCTLYPTNMEGKYPSFLDLALHVSPNWSCSTGPTTGWEWLCLDYWGFPRSRTVSLMSGCRNVYPYLWSQGQS